MATTPSAARQATQAVNSRSHSTRTDACAAPDPPAAPVFLEQSLFLNALAGPSNSHKPAPVPAPAPAGPVLSTKTNNRLSVAAAVTALQDRKRTAADLLLDESSPVAFAPLEEERPAKKRAVATAAPATATVVKDAATAAAAQETRRKVRKTLAQEKEKAAIENQQWRARFRKAFPSFTFYFDAIDETTKASLSAQVKRLGSSVDQFFSKKVTHVVTSRPVPTAAGKENAGSPTTSKTSGMVDSTAGKARKQSARSPKIYELPNGQKLRPLAGDLDKNPFIDSQDILSKALDFGLKIWPAEKLQLMLTRINHLSPSKENALQRDPSLPTLLREEQLYGTRERDPFVPRSDTYYFPSNKCYLLVEDSTGEHRPIVAKEYDKPRKHEDPSWPVLWGGIEGRTGFYRYDGEITYERRVPPAPPVAPAPQPTAAGKGGYGSTAARAIAPNLRRAVSLQNVAREQGRTYETAGTAGASGYGHGGRRDSFVAASGNSQIITSNIASATSTAARSGAVQASRFGANGGLVDKRLAVLSNRTVSVAGSGLAGGVARVQRMGMQRSVSVDGALHAARVPAAAAVPVRDEPKKPGYCENCRVKYDDFKDHVVSSKHRRFALNPKHWRELDALLEKIERPLVADPLEGQYDDSGFFDAVCASDEDDEAAGVAEYERCGREARENGDPTKYI
ncbi:Cdc7p-Dbf4p kinase complex regulatory subunit [Rhodotorula kratochvilovae]